MTNNTISALLAELIIKEDTWVELENKLPLIFLGQDGNCYTDDKVARYKFNSSEQLLEIVYGSLQNGTFVSTANETKNYTPEAFISYDLIAGMVRSVYKGSNGTYFQKPFH